MSLDAVKELAVRLAAYRPATGPLIVGLTGAVASGKSTLAEQLQAHLQSNTRAVEVVTTDGFLMTNARLTELDLLDQKGFPPSYDNAAFAQALTAIRTQATDFPAYSHVTYDIDPGLTRTLSPPDILIVEGLNLHHRAADPQAPDPLDLLVYLDADEADLETWYVTRFMDLWAAAEHDPTSFYARFRTMTAEQTQGLARTVWEQVNLKNLHNNIVLAKPTADLVVLKGPDHSITNIAVRS